MAGAHDCFKLEVMLTFHIQPVNTRVFANFDPDATKMDVIEM